MGVLGKGLVGVILWTCGGGVWVGSDIGFYVYGRVYVGGGGELRDCDMVTISPTSPPEPLRSSVSKFRAQIYNPE